MKRYIFPLLILCVALIFFACESNDQAVFEAKVLENSDILLVEPLEDAKEYMSSDKIVVNTKDATIFDIKGKQVTLSEIENEHIIEITYDGLIRESYPAQIYASKIKITEFQ